MVQPSLRGNVVVVVSCCYGYCFDHLVVAMVLTMRTAKMAVRNVLFVFQGRCESEAMVESWLSACSVQCPEVGCFLVLFSMVALPWQLGLAWNDLAWNGLAWNGLARNGMARYLNHRVVGYCYCYCCCCVHVLCYCCVLYNPPDHHPYKSVSRLACPSPNRNRRHCTAWSPVSASISPFPVSSYLLVQHSRKIQEDESFQESEMGQDFLGLVYHLWHRLLHLIGQ